MRRCIDIMSDLTTFEKYRKEQQKLYGKDITPFMTEKAHFSEIASNNDPEQKHSFKSAHNNGN